MQFLCQLFCKDDLLDRRGTCFFAIICRCLYVSASVSVLLRGRYLSCIVFEQVLYVLRTDGRGKFSVSHFWEEGEVE